MDLPRELVILDDIEERNQIEQINQNGKQNEKPNGETPGIGENLRVRITLSYQRPGRL